MKRRFRAYVIFTLFYFKISKKESKYKKGIFKKYGVKTDILMNIDYGEVYTKIKQGGC